MNKIINLVICVCIVSFLCACEGKRDKFLQWDKTFKEIKELQSTPLLKDELILGRPGAFKYIDSSLFIYDDLGDSLFMLIDLKDQNVDGLIVVGDPSSNNTQKLAAIGKEAKIPYVVCVADATEIDLDQIRTCHHIAITSGASTPTYLTDQICLPL